MTQIAPATKTLDEQFIDWESDVFGFGYGTGEPHVIGALLQFISLLKDRRSYDFEQLEEAMGPIPAWLLINTLCKAGIIEYGTSPRYGWMSRRGERLVAFLKDKSLDDVLEILGRTDEDYVHCYPDCCNCSEGGYVEGRRCYNAFWREEDEPKLAIAGITPGARSRIGSR